MWKSVQVCGGDVGGCGLVWKDVEVCGRIGKVQVSLQHQYRGSLKIVLVCPSGTRSTLAAPREADK
ncbi:hypothetical protein E2C01_065341 [Portunus trituberculatus]|uniref:P/Homo B domain-containing protein n=1 Tax=Portunus trituberculatus TaxID=210409 RepID=A0A5B7HIK6_PORTR|nr:hypothetical protein [Portunus trituberculatus]